MPNTHVEDELNNALDYLTNIVEIRTNTTHRSIRAYPLCSRFRQGGNHHAVVVCSGCLKLELAQEFVIQVTHL